MTLELMPLKAGKSGVFKLSKRYQSLHTTHCKFDDERCDGNNQYVSVSDRRHTDASGKTVMRATEMHFHHLTVIGPTDTTVVDGDAGRLTQVFANLLVNAAKFTDDGGRISVLIEREAGWALVKIRDSGIGIAPDMLERVFDAYVQAECASGGLGLGLSLVRHLIELHGGSVSAHSEGLGRGSEFIVRLPAQTGRESVGSLTHELNCFAVTPVGGRSQESGQAP